MDRLLSLILIGALVVGNSFSHSHSHCHSSPGMGGAHIHLGYGSDSQGYGHCRHSHSHSHSHPHKHVKEEDKETRHHHDVREEYESETPETARLSADQANEKELTPSCSAEGCTCSEQIVAVPLLVAIVENSNHAASVYQSVSILREYLLVPLPSRAVSDVHPSSCGPRYSTPIFLRHSALLI